AGESDRFCDLFGSTYVLTDRHQIVRLLARSRAVCLQVAKARASDAWVGKCGRPTPFMSRIAEGKAFLPDLMSRGFRRRANKLDLRTNPAFAGAYDFADDADFSILFPRFLDRLPDGGVVMCHPGLAHAALHRL